MDEETIALASKHYMPRFLINFYQEHGLVFEVFFLTL